MYNAYGILKIDKAFLNKYFSEERNERIIKEIYISNRFWNKIALFLMNIIEITFLSFGLALSIHKDDIISLLYQLVIQLILYFSMKQMGYYLNFQRKVCSYTMMALSLIIIVKYFYMNSMTPEEVNYQYYLDSKQFLSSWGYVMKINLTSVTPLVQFDRFKSISFELTCLGNMLLLFGYYSKLLKHERIGQPVGYVHHSQWLKQYMIPYYIFITLIAFDTFFAQNIIQFIVLCFIISIQFLWATGHESKNNVIKQAVFWSRRLYTLQLAILAFTQIAYVIDEFQQGTSLYNFMFVTGLILNPTPQYAAYIHVLLICYLLTFGQLYETSYENYQSYIALRQDYFKGSMQELKENLIDQEDNANEHVLARRSIKSALEQTIENQKQNVNKALLEQQEILRKREEEELKEKENEKKYNILNYQKFVEHYAPYVYVWILRITLIILAYGYHSYKGFVLISWVLASFIFNLIPFVNITIIVLMPLFILEFLFLYFINIPTLFSNTNLKSTQFYSIFGYEWQAAPLEIGIFFYVSIFLIMLIPSKYILRLSRDEFRVDLFKKCTDKKSNLLYQFLFYILKYTHLPALFLIFILGLKEYNIYYIGLMFFFVVFAASLKTYRKTDMLLIQYSAFFLFTQYLWSLVSANFDSTGAISKIFNMITYSNQSNANAGINQYLDYEIPYDQWAVFFSFIFLTAINAMYKDEIPHKWRTDPDDPTQEKLYTSTAAYYEDKCDSVLRKKFPLIAKYLNRVIQIISQFIIIVILILQCAIVALQTPSVFYWGFLILSLMLQTVVIKSSEDNPKFYSKCVTQSRILGIYSMCVLIAQVSYFFITNDNFLAQYNLQDYLNYISGPLVQYYTIIGFKKFSTDTNIAAAFGSQIAFYIMAAYLLDFFQDAEFKYNLQKEQEELQDETNYNTSIILRKPGVQKKKTTELQPQQTLASPSKLNKTEDEIEEEDQIERIKYSFENVRYTIPYYIYKRQDLWRLIDSISMNFHLVTATVTIYYCCNWQISLFMAFYLCCSLILCIRASKDLYKAGQVGVKISAKGQGAVSIEEAHALNKSYMEKAQSTLLKIRSNQWNYQYWILVFSMIIMYPTPALQRMASNQFKDSQQEIYTSIFWLFWTGVFKSQADITEISSHLPLYIMMLLLIIEKQFQKWSRNRFGCTIERIQQYKFIDENMRLVEDGLSSQRIKERIEDVQRNYKLARAFKEHSDISVSIGEARIECEKIERLYREQNEETRKEQLRNNLTLALKRKYFYVFRSSLKIILEQTSLLLLLLSCSIKSNVISILYLGLLLYFILIKNKTKGMLVMSYVFGIMIIVQYLLNLTNLTSENAPQDFPSMFNPYPNENYPVGYFIFPWIPRFEVFTDLPTLAHFLGLDTDHSNINDIWYDFANSVLLTIYFFNSGNPIDTQNIKVSFSLSKGCEYDLNLYAQIMKKQKAELKQGLIDLTMKEQPDKEEYSRDFDVEKSRNFDRTVFEESFSSQAADNSKEYLLGPTFYLMDLKQRIFYYYFTKKMRYFAYIGWQLFTIIAVFTLAFLCKSYFSVGYLLMCVPLIWFVTDFFNSESLSQNGKIWKNPYIICGPLMIYSFVDISVQIIFGSFLHTSNFWKDTLGVSNLWIIGEFTGMEVLLTNNTDLAVLEAERLKFSILKCINLFFIFLQSRIYESEGFSKFVKEDLKKLLGLAKSYKRMALSYRYNNSKIQQILTLQENKRRMFQGVSELKMKLKLWNELVQSGLTSAKNAHLNPSKSKENLFAIQSNDEEAKQDNNQSFASSLFQTTQQDSKKEPLLQTQTTSAADLSKRQRIFEKLKQSNKIAKISALAELDDDYFEKQHLMKKMIKKLPRFGRYYQNLKSKKINQICFMTNVEDLKNVKKNMEEGKRKIQTELEEIMMRDINIYYARKQALQKMSKTGSTGALGLEKFKSQKTVVPQGGKVKVEKLEFEHMPYTSEFLKPSNILPALFGAYMEYYFSNCAVIAYVFMLLSQIINAGLISILYPFAVFGYALMEEQRPGKKFWNFMILYTLFILFMKFLFQLDTWVLIPGLQSTYSNLNDWVLFGLWRTESTRAMFFYILPELGVLLALMGQVYYEILIGLHEQREIELENIQQARERFLRALNKKNQNQTQTIQQTQQQQQRQFTIDEEQQPQTNLVLDEFGYTEDERIKEFLTKIKATHIKSKQKLYREDNNFIRAAHEVDRKEFTEEVAQFQPRRRYSMVDDSVQRKFISQKLKDERKSKKKQTFVKKYFARKSYFQRLFPLVKEQKPGKDLYGEITFWQFVICVYLIAYYTEMDAVGTQNLEAKTNTRVVVRKIGSGGAEDQRSFDDKLLQTMKVSSSVDFQTSVKVNQMEQSDTAVNLMSPQHKKDELKADQTTLILEYTKMTTQQVFKYLIQWFLLIFYHGLVFWYFPLRSNYAIYGQPTCDEGSVNFEKYGCLSFKRNIFLILFYLIFCYYFMLSAMQIRHGYPDFKRGSSLFDHQDRLHWIYYLIFYNLPFLLETKTILDWTFTKTSLDMFQWLQIVQFQSEQFMAKISGYFTFGHPLGKQIHIIEKCVCGCFCLSLILFFLVGPFLLFSNLSFIASQNLVTDLKTNFNMRIWNKNTSEIYLFPLFEANTPLFILPMTQEEFNARGYNVKVETKFFDYTQVQKIKIKNASEEIWGVSLSYKQDFQKMLQQASNQDPNLEIEIDFYYVFTRPGPLEAPQASGNNSRNLNQSHPADLALIRQFYTAVSMECTSGKHNSTSIIIPDFVQEEVRLTQQPTTMALEIGDIRGLNLTYDCHDYWSLATDEGDSLEFTTFSDLIAASFVSASSITAFYLAVTFMAGGVLRGFIYKGERVFIVDSRNSQALLNLIDCIYLMRHLQNLKKEEELFFVLMDILRSPEVMKVITGISLRDDEVAKTH